MSNKRTSYLKCSKCNKEYSSTILPPQVHELWMKCDCGGTIVRINNYKEKNFSIKELLKMDTERISHKSDCLGCCFIKLFLYYGKTGFERLYSKPLSVKSEANCVDENGLYNIQNSTKIEYPNYINLLKKVFNVDVHTYEHCTFDIIAMNINDKIPVIVVAPGNLLKWVGRGSNEGHAFVVVGYDLENGLYTCVDPYFSSKHTFLSIEMLEYSNYGAFTCDFTNFSESHCEDNLFSELYHHYEMVYKSPASVEFQRINIAIKHNEPYISQYNHFYYALSAKIHLALSGRFACLSSYYQYLFEKYNIRWLLRISEIYQACFTLARKGFFLFLKYNFSNNPRDKIKYLNTVYLYEASEKEVENILLGNK